LERSSRPQVDFPSHLPGLDTAENTRMCAENGRAASLGYTRHNAMCTDLLNGTYKRCRRSLAKYRALCYCSARVTGNTAIDNFCDSARETLLLLLACRLPASNRSTPHKLSTLPTGPTLSCSAHHTRLLKVSKVCIGLHGNPSHSQSHGSVPDCVSGHVTHASGRGTQTGAFNRLAIC